MNHRRKKKQQTDPIIELKLWLAKLDWRDYSQKPKRIWAQLPRLHQRALTFLFPLVLVIALLPSSLFEPREVQPQTPQRIELDLDSSGLSQQRTSGDTFRSDDWKEYQIQSGDTLSQVFRNNNLPLSDLNALVKIEGRDKPLSKIKQGQLFRYKLAEDGSLDMIQLERDDQSVMFFRSSDGSFGRTK